MVGSQALINLGVVLGMDADQGHSPAVRQLRRIEFVGHVIGNRRALNISQQAG